MTRLGFMPIVAAVAVLAALMLTALWAERSPGAPPYTSPCIVSWDENADAAVPSTFCIMTREAAEKEKVLGHFDAP